MYAGSCDVAARVEPGELPQGAPLSSPVKNRCTRCAVLPHGLLLKPVQGASAPDLQAKALWHGLGKTTGMKELQDGREARGANPYASRVGLYDTYTAGYVPCSVNACGVDTSLYNTSAQ